MNSKMKVKIATAVVLIAIVVPVIILGGLPLKILVGIASALAGYEVANMQSEKSKWFTTVLNTAVIIALYTFDVRFFPMIAAFYITILFAGVMVDEKVTAEYAAYSFTIVLIAGMALRGLFRLYDFEHGALLMLYVALATYVCDTGAYFFGVFFGKHKLIPRVSPNKTVEGSIGGYASGAMVSMVFGMLCIKELPVSLIVAGSLTLPLLAQLGDLSFSSIKRHFKIKDFGSIFPEHGGCLDRVDSLLFCLMFFNALLVLWGF